MQSNKLGKLFDIFSVDHSVVFYHKVYQDYYRVSQKKASSLNARKYKKTITSTSTLDWFDSPDSNLKNDVLFLTIILLLAELCLY